MHALLWSLLLPLEGARPKQRQHFCQEGRETQEGSHVCHVVGLQTHANIYIKRSFTVCSLRISQEPYRKGKELEREGSFESFLSIASLFCKHAVVDVRIAESWQGERP